jgi:hypothetical protein
MSTPIVKISAARAGGSHVIVDSGYADSLYRYLAERSVEVTLPQEAISRTIRIYRAEDGRIKREEEPLDHTFDTKAKADELEKLIGEWLKSIQ